MIGSNELDKSTPLDKVVVSSRPNACEACNQCVSCDGGVCVCVGGGGG